MNHRLPLIWYSVSSQTFASTSLVTDATISLAVHSSSGMFAGNDDTNTAVFTQRNKKKSHSDRLSDLGCHEHQLSSSAVPCPIHYCGSNVIHMFLHLRFKVRSTLFCCKMKWVKCLWCWGISHSIKLTCWGKCFQWLIFLQKRKASKLDGVKWHKIDLRVLLERLASASWRVRILWTWHICFGNWLFLSGEMCLVTENKSCCHISLFQFLFKLTGELIWHAFVTCTHSCL